MQAFPSGQELRTEVKVEGCDPNGVEVRTVTTIVIKLTEHTLCARPCHKHKLTHLRNSLEPTPPLPQFYKNKKMSRKVKCRWT